MAPAPRTGASLPPRSESRAGRRGPQVGWTSVESPSRPISFCPRAAEGGAPRGGSMMAGRNRGEVSSERSPRKFAAPARMNADVELAFAPADTFARLARERAHGQVTAFAGRLLLA